MLTVAVFAPLVGALVVASLARVREAVVRAMAVAIAAVPLVLMAVAWLRYPGGPGFHLVESARWIPTLGVTYKVGVDGISLPLGALTALLFVASVAYPVDVKGRPRHYYATFLFLECVSLGLFLALDLFLFYVFFDLSLVGMYFLIAVWGHGNARRSALKFFLYTLAGTLVMLLGILGLYLSTSPRTFDMVAIIAQQPLAGGGAKAALIFAALAVGLGIKTPVVPFHTWLPPAHVDAPAPASTILAGVLLKMGTYGFVRILLQMLPDTFRQFAPWLGVIAVVSIVYGSLVALAQTNLKRLIAYTSVTHMGYVILGVAAAGGLASREASARAIALTGATVEMVAHGLITGALFLVAGSFWQRGETYEMGEYGGLASRAPMLAGATLVGAFASLGLPGLVGFVAEFQVFAGAVSVYPVLAALGLLGLVLTAALFLRMLAQLFFGPLPPRWADWPDLSANEAVVLAPLLALVIALGVAPAWLVDVVHASAAALIGR
ncbi:MAG: oxidoreductase [Candidatus Aeolococcus gillhamiae]|uniref:Oxidoreductase n=1 Tax=Candidatus Aeolococcus gillhamiae TaxID=3127015 RepID=A0A2W6A6L2_9BACT|nr:MAG: oxidoreductase [Candidatus Dormibacter sp. RRmetagenome_bin12]